jgi:hypothetical protein
MNIKHDEHQSRTLKHGVVGYFVRRPGSRRWSILFADLSWVEGDFFEGFTLKVKTWWPQKLGWEKLRFGSPDEAGGFIESEIRIQTA